MIIKLSPFEFDCTAYTSEQLEDVAIWAVNCLRYNSREASDNMPYFLDISEFWIASLRWTDRAFFMRSLWDYIYSESEASISQDAMITHLSNQLQSSSEHIDMLNKKLSELANPIQ